MVDFWDDLLNLTMDRHHYTGLLSLKAVPRAETRRWENDAWLLDNGYRPYHVVDGQQRLTTTAILLNEIVCLVHGLEDNRGQDDGTIVLGYQTLKEIRAKYISRKRPPMDIVTSYLFGYETDNPNSDYLQYKVFNEPFMGTVEETYYTKNLKYAKEFFADCLQQLYAREGLEGIENVYKKLTLRLMFNIHEIEDDYDVFVAFETMNNRGKRLTNLELLKNRLIYLTTLFSKVDATDKAALRGKINDAWKEMYYQLGRNHNASLSDDEFLRAHWIIYFHYSRQRGDDYIKFLLSKFSAKNVFEKLTTPLQQAAPSVSIDAPEDDDDDTVAADPEAEVSVTTKLDAKEIERYVDSLKEAVVHWYNTFFPARAEALLDAEKLWLDKLNRIGIGYFRPLVAAAFIPSVKASFADRLSLLKAIERFIFVCFRMGSFHSSYKSSDIYRKTHDLYHGATTVTEIVRDLESTTELDIPYAINNFITRIDKRFVSGDGFYGWRDLRYLLYEYEFEKSVQYKLPKVDWRLFTAVEKDRISIEHILPQTPTKWYWRNQFRQFTDDEIRTLSGSLGNLLPLSQSINASLQNDSFSDKKTTLREGRRGYENGSHSEIEVSKDDDWDAQRILDRGLRLMRFMEKRWGIAFQDDAQMIDLLHLRFVLDQRPVPAELPEEPATTRGEVQDDDGTHATGKRLAF